MIQTTEERHDVVICGGGLAGLLLARQLRRELPQLSVLVLERTSRPLPTACHKVGESSVELASQYLERMGFTEYLLDEHIVKLGLRFFPGGGELPLVERVEVGPCAEPVVRSYQLDRGKFETDLRGFIEEDGAKLVEGARVDAVDLSKDDNDHRVTYTVGDAQKAVTARWVVDATGRNALFRRQLKQTRGLGHAANAGWFRTPGRVDINDLVPESETEWHERPCGDERWRSTNHLMGTGYWVWLIPLSTGNTSIGLVVHDEVHGHKVVSSYDEMFAFLQKNEPQLAELLEDAEPSDYLCLRKYSHSVGRAWSHERWAMVGEAGAFVDPLYSPGSDFIAIANCFTTEMIRVELDGGDTKAKAMQLNGHYRSMIAGTICLFRGAHDVYGHPDAMATKVFWDNFTYWSFTCHFFQQDVYRYSAEDYEPFVAIGQRFLELGDRMQELLAAWADLAPGVQRREFIGAPHFPSILIDAHTKTGEKMTREELLAYLDLRVPQLEMIALEIMLRIVQQLSPEQAKEALERCKFHTWGIEVTPERIETERMKGHPRRVRLTTICRDLERTLGKIPYHERVEETREMLLGVTAKA